MIFEIKQQQQQQQKRSKKENGQDKKEKKRIPVQVTPFPSYPALQAQVKLPAVLVHFAFDEHPPLLVEHSFISVDFWFGFFLGFPLQLKKKTKNSLPAQEIPFPEYPVLHLHVKLPTVFVHVAVPAAQLFPPPSFKHSFTSFFFFFFFWEENESKNKSYLPLQLKPFPSKPFLQAQLKLPTLFVHNAFDEHPPLFVEHSSISFDFFFLNDVFVLFNNNQSKMYHCK